MSLAIRFFFGMSLAGLAFVFAGCGQGKLSESSTEKVEEGVESGTSSVSSAMDEIGEVSFALQTSLREPEESEVGAYSSACVRPRWGRRACDSGVKTVTYDNCTRGSAALNGSISLTYSDTLECKMDAAAKTVTRAPNLTISGATRGTLTISSGIHTDYDDIKYDGGGQKLTYVDSSTATLQILGISRVAEKDGEKKFDIFTRTTADVTVTGGLSKREGRVVNGGAIQVIHNLKEYRATFKPSQVTWTADCCHPVSGTMSITFEGSIEGDAEIVFTGCGTATVTKSGATETLSLKTDSCD